MYVQVYTEDVLSINPTDIALEIKWTDTIFSCNGNK